MVEVDIERNKQNASFFTQLKSWVRKHPFATILIATFVFLVIMPMIFLITYLPPAHAMYYQTLLGAEGVYTKPGIKLIPLPTNVITYSLGAITVHYMSSASMIYDGDKYVLNPKFDHVYALTQNQLWVKLDGFITFKLVPTKKAILKFYHLFPAGSGEQSVRAFIDSVVTPTVITCTKNVIANMTIEQVVKERTTVEKQIANCVYSDLAKYGDIVQVLQFQVGQMYLPSQVLKAIENKVAAQQELIATKYKAEQEVVKARAQAKAEIIRAEAQANATLIQYKAIAKGLKLLTSSAPTDIVKTLLLVNSGVKPQVIWTIGQSAPLPIVVPSR